MPLHSSLPCKRLQADFDHALFVSLCLAVKKAAEQKSAGAGTGERRRSSVTTEKVKLNSGHYIPQVALGVYKAPNDGTTESAVKWAFEAGYRHVDSGEKGVRGVVV